MGSSVSSVMTELRVSQEQTDKEKLERLNFVLELVKAKLDTFQAELERKVLDSVGTATITGKRVIRWERGIRSISENPEAGIDDVVDSALGKKTENTDASAIRDGFEFAIKSALSPFLQNNAAGDHEEEKYFLYVMHGAIIRIDLKLWRYNFNTNGFMDSLNSILGYISCFSIVDSKEIGLDEFKYIISTYADDDMEKYGAYVRALEKAHKEAYTPKLFAPVDATALPT